MNTLPQLRSASPTIGILGSGQLARMTVQAAHRMGYQVIVYTGENSGEKPVLDTGIKQFDDPAAPVASICPLIFRAGFEDKDALKEFGQLVDIVTLEFENIPVSSLRTLSKYVPVKPDWTVLEISQNRAREKQFLQRFHYPCAAFQVVESLEELEKAVQELGRPCVLKTAEFGYDGKGQIKITESTSLQQAWSQWIHDSPKNQGTLRGVLEEWIDYSTELSVICARNQQGQIKAFPVIENIHTNHILDFSIAPARVSHQIANQAIDLAKAITAELKVEGLLAVEMFLLKNGSLVVNELAPRSHNSGHLTLDATITSQFEQHIRAVCNLPLGNVDFKEAAVMVNLLGDLWKEEDKAKGYMDKAKGHMPSAAFHEPDWKPIFADEATKLHLYGKTHARVGRKMGHYCVLGSDVESCLERARLIKSKFVSNY